MQSNHTPGPWYADKLQDRNAYNIFAPGHCAALVTLEPGKYDGASPLCQNVHADAALIAAAPDLLAALQEIVDHFRRTGDPTLGDMAPRARAAIARAIEPTDDQFMAALGPCGK